MNDSTTCDRCDGSGIEEHTNLVNCAADGTLSASIRPGHVVPGSEGEVSVCYQCHGFLIIKKQYGDAYKTLATAQAGLKRGTGRKCTSCETGWKRRVDVYAPCYPCSATGVLPTYAPGRVLDIKWGRCDNMSDVASAQFAAAVTIIVQRDAAFTWNDSFLGLGSIVSVTDYGRTAELTDDQIVSMIRERLAKDHTQWINIIDATTRVMGDTVVVGVSRNGYTVKVANIAVRLPMLPPTYTDAVLNRPV